MISLTGWKRKCVGGQSSTLRSLPVEFITNPCSPTRRHSRPDVQATARRRSLSARGQPLCAQGYGRAGRPGSVELHTKLSVGDAFGHRLTRRWLRESDQRLQALKKQAGKAILGHVLVRIDQGGVGRVTHGDGDPGGP